MKNTFRHILLAMCLSLFGLLQQANATTYYVDFNNGSDANNGLTQGTAWLNIPGTQNVTNTGVVSGATGWHSIAAGDTIKIKPGTTHDSSKGGLIKISSANYALGATAANPITITTDQTWATGQAVINGTGTTVPSYWGLITVYGVPGVVIDGGVTNGIMVENSAYYNVLLYASSAGNTTVNWIVNNIQLYNSRSAGIITVQNGGDTNNYKMSNITFNNINCDLTNGANDGEECIGVWDADNVVVKNSTASRGCNNSAGSCDGIHFGQVSHGLIDSCTVHDNWEQGIDISKDKKTTDNGYVTVRNCIAYNNFKDSYDTNSGNHDIYFINNIGWKTFETSVGDANFEVYETGYNVFFINNTSVNSYDTGFGFYWFDNANAYLPSGTQSNYMMNNVSYLDGYGNGSRSTGSNSVALDAPAYGWTNNVYGWNNNLASKVASSNSVISAGGTSLQAASINTTTGGWYGKGNISSNPLYVNPSGTTWAVTDLTLQSISPNKNAGVFPFTTSGAGSGTTINLTPLTSALDARYVFFPGDKIQIQGGGTATVATVPSATQIILTSSQTWASGAGIWYPWPNQKLDIGAMSAGTVGSVLLPAPTLKP